MFHRSREQPNKPARRRSLNAAVVAAIAILFSSSIPQFALAASYSSPDKPVSGPDVHPASDSTPVFKLVEGAKGSPDPYTPRVLNVPVGKKVALDITDNIGGCALVTVFPGLAPDGGDVRARVPVGQTKRVVILAAKPGKYRYHCSENMYFGEIVAR